MKVLLSIKPQFAEKIFNGTKKYEFRRAIFRNKDVKTVIVYASSPIQQVIGEFEIEEIIEDDILSLWDETKKHSGIEKDFFFKYFSNKKKGFAIKIKKTTKYKHTLCIKKDFNIEYPPQSFIYLPAQLKINTGKRASARPVLQRLGTGI